MKKTYNKIMVAVGSFLPVLAFAEGNDYSSAIDTAEATSALTAIKTQLLAWVSSATPLLVAVAGAFMVFWLLLLAFKLIKKFSTRTAG